MDLRRLTLPPALRANAGEAEAEERADGGFGHDRAYVGDFHRKRVNCWTYTVVSRRRSVTEHEREGG
jgi:hypothetical protein